LAGGCASDFEKQSHISKLRILAVKAEPAELIADKAADPPQTTLTALAVDPSGATIEVRWALCTAQGVPSPSIDCPGAQGLDLLADASFRGKLDLGSQQFRGAYQQILTGQAGFPPDQVAEQLAQGVPLIVGFTALLGAQRFPGLTTITLRSPDANKPVNQNPGVASLFAGDFAIADDGSTTVPTGATVHLTPVPSEGSHELTADGYEKLNYSFYSTDGEVQTLRSTDTTASGTDADPSIDWIAPKTPGTVQLWVVVRDGRGGVGWLARTLTVQ
jgi:hypothetical protein